MDVGFDDNDDHLEDEEDGDGDEGLAAVLLLGDEGEGEVGVDSKQDNLLGTIALMLVNICTCMYVYMSRFCS